MKRRSFIKTAAVAATGFTIVSPNILAGKNYSTPSEKISVALIGCGTQGIRQLMDHITNDGVRFVAVCDPTKSTNNYIEYFDGELKNKIRSFLGDQRWDENEVGCRAGREVAKEIIERYYLNISDGKEKITCRDYEDYRVLLEKENDLDAVYIMTPDHHHASISVAAMRKGKHVIMHKPMATTVAETRYVAKVAKETGVATHMFCAESIHTTPLLSEWIWDGAIGNVTEVHNWSTRPVWPQGWTKYPEEKMDIPEGFNWDLWLGPAKYREYNSAYTHSLFRGWKDFGTGALGDMGHYSFRQIFQMLKLELPVKVEASANIVSEIENQYWLAKPTDISYPNASIVHFDFPERDGMPPVKLNWYDGCLRPPLPKELEIEGRKMPNEGLLIVGDKGKILGGFRGDSPRIIPESKMREYKRPEEYLERPIDGFDQWVNACKGGKPSSARFEAVAKLTETICLGNIALRFDDKLNYNSEEMRFENSEEANNYLTREIRDGWEF
ncbi:MAG: Gfo/Idh/MocA family oxidoreductase [Melioribacteraceae bacterium]|nr:Gfo/Idh/MocA family oxidoreductase [Melioribacteraceae bacterium]